MKENNHSQALYTLVSVFFFWGFIVAGNNILIPFCKKNILSLDQFQSQLIEFAFYGAYYIGALSYLFFSSVSKRNILNFWGFKSTIVFSFVCHWCYYYGICY